MASCGYDVTGMSCVSARLQVYACSGRTADPSSLSIPSRSFQTTCIWGANTAALQVTLLSPTRRDVALDLRSKQKTALELFTPAGLNFEKHFIKFEFNSQMLGTTAMKKTKRLTPRPAQPPPRPSWAPPRVVRKVPRLPRCPCESGESPGVPPADERRDGYTRKTSRTLFPTNFSIWSRFSNI